MRDNVHFLTCGITLTVHRDRGKQYKKKKEHKNRKKNKQRLYEWWLQVCSSRVEQRIQFEWKLISLSPHSSIIMPLCERAWAAACGQHISAANCLQFTYIPPTLPHVGPESSIHCRGRKVFKFSQQLQLIRRFCSFLSHTLKESFKKPPKKYFIPFSKGRKKKTWHEFCNNNCTFIKVPGSTSYLPIIEAKHANHRHNRATSVH